MAHKVRRKAAPGGGGGRVVKRPAVHCTAGGGPSRRCELGEGGGVWKTGEGLGLVCPRGQKKNGW